jgi:eukaryotic-like serine/threonine-protein kinase
MMGSRAASLGDGDRYELLGELASGGMATVYLARMRRPLGFARLVAVKCMHAQFAKDPSFTTMFLDEARLTARLHHPNIVPTLDIVSDDGHLLLVMEYVEGESLAAILRSASSAGVRAPFPIACAIVHDVLLGLHEAHEAKDDDGAPLGIVHRDVSPQNVIVGVDGLARVLDFGVAKAHQNSHRSNDNEIKGKIPYMPPEQLYGEAVDRRVDVYAAGVTLWETLVGARLFDGPSETAVVRRITEQPVEPPSARVADLPADLDGIVLRALSPSADDRFPTALEMAQQIASLVALPTRTEVSAWVRQFVAPRVSTASGERPSVNVTQRLAMPHRAEATTILAVLERARTREASFVVERTAIAPRRRVPIAAAIGAVAVAVALSAAAFAGVAWAARSAEPTAAAGNAGATPSVAAAALPAEPSAQPADPAPHAGTPEDAPAKSAGTPARLRAARAFPTPRAAGADARGASCRPPYVVDALGHRHYKVECL